MPFLVMIACHIFTSINNHVLWLAPSSIKDPLSHLIKLYLNALTFDLFILLSLLWYTLAIVHDDSWLITDWKQYAYHPYPCRKGRIYWLQVSNSRSLAFSLFKSICPFFFPQKGTNIQLATQVNGICSKWLPCEGLSATVSYFPWGQRLPKTLCSQMVNDYFRVTRHA